MLLSSAPKLAFTLIEILIVLAILGLLAALLFPAFARARESGRRATCAGNLSQINLAISLYATDNNKHYPNIYFASEHTACTWVNSIFPYVKSGQIFHCPDYLEGEFRPGCPAPDNSVEPPLTYAGSYSLLSLPKARNFRAMDFRHPTTTILVIDGLGSLVSPGNPGTEETPAPGPVLNRKWIEETNVRLRHTVGGREGDNVLWADGHVKWLSLEAMFDRHLWRAEESDQAAQRERAKAGLAP